MRLRDFGLRKPVSLVGSAITSLGRPLTAVLLLSASPAQVGCSSPATASGLSIQPLCQCIGRPLQAPIADQNERGRHWLAKIPSRQDRSFTGTAIEYPTMRLAARCGLDVPDQEKRRFRRSAFSYARDSTHHWIFAFLRSSSWKACSFFCCSDSAICGFTSSNAGIFAARVSSSLITW